MGKKRTRITNPEPFAAADDYQPSVASTKRSSKASKIHQLQNKVIPKGMSSKILKEAMLQQKEIEEEEIDGLNAENNNNIKTSDWNSVTESVAKEIVDEEGDIDDFPGFSETQSHYGGVEIPHINLALGFRYKNELTKEDKVSLNALVGRQRHMLVTPEILRELNNSRNRGEKEDVMISAPASVIYKTIEEDRFEFPEVPMED